MQRAIPAEGIVTLAAPLPDARSLKSAIYLPDLARSRYGLRLRRAGRQWVSLCCFHCERHPSLFIDSRRFHCFGCGASGDAFRFIMLRESCDFPRALRTAADFVNSPARLATEAAQRPKEHAGRRPAPYIARKKEPRAIAAVELPVPECAAERAWVIRERAVISLRRGV